MSAATHRPDTADAAAESMAEPGAMALGGGTDLRLAIGEGIAAPSSLIDLGALPGARDITLSADGGARLGAAVLVADVARHPELRRRFRALAESCDVAGPAELRSVSTLAGNICQRPHCQYFRGGVPCFKNGGDRCPAVEGDNRYHAILGGDPCYIVHPSDVAVALVALEATIELRCRGRTRRVPASEFFVLPRERLDHETVLERGEFITAIELPAYSSGGVQRYHKLTDDDRPDFAVVSLATIRRGDGEIRLVLGGVAPRPWRVAGSIEEDVGAGNLDESDIATLAARAMYDAAPLSMNGFKVELAEAQLRRGMEEVVTSG
jgi:xanthine dehydrogenase YagS FAD-binding subunit